jgi:uncharacterized protein (DUF4415 family)
MELCNKNVNMRIEQSLLEEFKHYAGSKYQTKIKQLMKHYVEDMKKEERKRIKKDNSIATDFLTK